MQATAVLPQLPPGVPGPDLLCLRIQSRMFTVDLSF